MPEEEMTSESENQPPPPEGIHTLVESCPEQDLKNSSSSVEEKYVQAKERFAAAQQELYFSYLKVLGDKYSSLSPSDKLIAFRRLESLVTQSLCHDPLPPNIVTYDPAVFQALRKKEGLTQDQLSRQLDEKNLSTSMISRFETGAYTLKLPIRNKQAIHYLRWMKARGYDVLLTHMPH